MKRGFIFLLSFYCQIIAMEKISSPLTAANAQKGCISLARGQFALWRPGHHQLIASQEDKINLVDAHSGQPVVTFEKGILNSFKEGCSEGGSYFIALGTKNHPRHPFTVTNFFSLWQVATGKLIASDSTAQANIPVFSPQEKYVAYQSEDSQYIYVKKIANQEHCYTFSFNNPSRSLVSPVAVSVCQVRSQDRINSISKTTDEDNILDITQSDDTSIQDDFPLDLEAYKLRIQYARQNPQVLRGKFEAPTPLLPHALQFSSNDKFIAYENQGYTHVIDLEDRDKKMVRLSGLLMRFGKATNTLLLRDHSTLKLYALENLGTPLASCTNDTFYDYNSSLIVNDQCNRVWCKSIIELALEMHDILAQVKLAKPRYKYENFITISTDFSKAVCSYRPEHSIPASPFHLRLEVTDLQNFCYTRELNIPASTGMQHEKLHCYFSPNQEYLFIENATHLIIWNFKKGACCKEKVRPTREYSTCSANSDYVLWRPDLNYSEVLSLDILPFEQILK